MENVRLYVLDAYGRPSPIGAEGELYLGGEGVARGYLGRAALTAERFTPDPFSAEPGGRLYRTGDLARHLDDGNLEFVGRRDGQVKVRGHRVELGEIEALMRQEEGVRDAVVVVRQDARGEQRLVAYVVPGTPERPSLIDEMRATLRQQLPDYMIPAAFVRLDSLPLTANGKVDRRALPEPETRGRASAPPATEAEREVARIWAEVLELEKVGRDEDFFELGGHSLLATRVQARVRAAFDIELPVQDLFEHPTVADFAEHVESIRWTAQGLEAPAVAAAAGREEGEL
jgi:acyl carrier protein